MKKITFEEFSKMSFNEVKELMGEMKQLTEDDNSLELEDPISGKSIEEIDEYLRNHGYLPIEEVDKKINEMFDKALNNR